MQDKTHIYKKRFEDTHYYKHQDKLHELQKKFHIINGVIEQETPIYIILNNNIYINGRQTKNYSKYTILCE